MTPVTDKIAPTTVFGQDAETHSVLRTMVEAKKEELKDLQQLMLKEQAYLKKLRDEQVTERQICEQELRVRRQAFEQETARERNQLRAVQKDLEQVSQDIAVQKKELDILVSNAESIRQEKDETVKARIGMEQQRIRAGELHQQAEASLHQLHAAQAEFEAVQLATEALRVKVEQQDQVNQATEESLVRREQSTQLDLEQVTLLRQEIDPKLEQLGIREQAIKDQTLRVETLQREGAEQKAELAQAKADLDGLSQRLTAKETMLTEREVRLKQLQSELNVKLQQAKVKGITIETPTE